MKRDNKTNHKKQTETRQTAKKRETLLDQFLQSQKIRETWQARLAKGQNRAKYPNDN